MTGIWLRGFEFLDLVQVFNAYVGIRFAMRLFARFVFQRRTTGYRFGGTFQAYFRRVANLDRFDSAKVAKVVRVNFLSWFLAYWFGLYYICCSCVVTYVGVQNGDEFVFSPGGFDCFNDGATWYLTFDVGGGPFAFSITYVDRGYDFRTIWFLPRFGWLAGLLILFLQNWIRSG